MITYTTLITADEFLINLETFKCFDTRFNLAAPEKGEEDYARGHIPGAIYAHLDRDLCGPIIPQQTGRHPLPEPDIFVNKLQSWGVRNDDQVIVYDDAGGSYAARLWWMLKWAGHDAVALLDGGWQAWISAGYPTITETPLRTPGGFSAKFRPELLASTEEVIEMEHQQDTLLVDARMPIRYRGETEPIDPVAGRIPWAANLPHTEVLDENYGTHSSADLRAKFNQLFHGVSPERVVYYCGSGVTAARDLVAQAHAGLGLGKLYAGSWSEWINDPKRPISKG